MLRCHSALGIARDTTAARMSATMDEDVLANGSSGGSPLRMTGPSTGVHGGCFRERPPDKGAEATGFGFGKLGDI